MENSLSRGMELLRNRWQMLAVFGVASVILGTIAIMAAFFSTLATVFFLGCLVMGGAMVHLIQSFNTRGWAGFFGHALAAILYGVSGWYMIMHPTIGAMSLTLVIGMLLAVGGLYQIISSVATR